MNIKMEIESKTHKVRPIADFAKLQVEVVGEIFQHGYMGLLSLGFAIEAILATNVTENGIGLSQLQIPLKNLIEINRQEETFIKTHCDLF